LLLPLSLDGLNCDNFVPESKDEDLHAGILQVPAGTMFVVTETGVQEGKLIEKGNRSTFFFWLADFPLTVFCLAEQG